MELGGASGGPNRSRPRPRKADWQDGCDRSLEWIFADSRNLRAETNRERKAPFEDDDEDGGRERSAAVSPF